MMAKLVVIGWSIFCLWGALYGLNEISEKFDIEDDAVAFGASLGLFFWMILWGVVVVPTALMGMLFRSKTEEAGNQAYTGQKTIPSRPSLDRSASPRRVGISSSKAVASTVDEELEGQWETLVRYDPDIQSALTELAEFGDSGIKELKKAYMAVNDSSKLGYIVETIRADQLAQRKKEGVARELAKKNQKDLREALGDRSKIEIFLNKEGLHIVEHEMWIDIYDSSSNEKIRTVFSMEDVGRFLLSRFS